MSVVLEGGCRVSEMREGDAVEIGTLRVWPQIGQATGARAISLRVLEFSPGVSPGLRNEACDEILYVQAGHLMDIFIDGWPYAVGPTSGIYLRPGQTLTVNNASDAPLVMISSRCPEPASEPFATVAPVTTPAPSLLRSEHSPVVRLAERQALPTADRWYRVLVDEDIGSSQVTQFVGSIPPGRAPDHFHQYEEVLFILHGSGRMWAGETHAPIAAGACVYLPKGQVHCVENTGADELRLLGVFYPAGSPSVRYEVH